ncbi:MAG: hypothetical protein IPM82_20700 [Saprospiraceae bacterium]|nr:hypothetical protein [Saprospiraceae bacterium]
MNEDKHIEETEAWLKESLPGSRSGYWEEKLVTDASFVAEVEMLRDMTISIELAGKNRTQKPSSR